MYSRGVFLTSLNGKVFPSILKFSFVLISLFATQTVFAQNFTIAPASGYAFPSTVSAGGLTSAYYTVTNNTSSKRSGYTVQGLPNSVRQNANGMNCTNPISLASKASCLLQLDITSAVQSGFAICNGSSCTTAAVPLNVTLSTIPPAMVLAGSSTNIPMPLVAQTSDGGTSWSYPTLPASVTAGLFSSVSCSGVYCIAAGENDATSPPAPLVARTANDGLTWSYPTLPSSITAGRFSGVSCSGSVCVAAGENDATLKSAGDAKFQ